MSRFSGKCDFADMLSFYVFRSKNHSKLSTNTDTKPMTELDAFEKFRQETGGVIYQFFKVEVNKNNIAQLSKIDEFLKPTENGKGCIYFDEEFKTFKSFNKKVNYCTLREIHFETMIDLIQYYPYTIARSYPSNSKLKVIISPESYVDVSYRDNIELGIEAPNNLYNIYKRNLMDEYIRVAKLYDKTAGFNDEDTAKLWYKLNYGNDE